MRTRAMTLSALAMTCGVAVSSTALFMIWAPSVEAGDASASDEPVGIETLGADVTPTEGEIATSSPISPDDTSWGVPVTVSPKSGAKLYHSPRMTTLVWRPVVGATYYVVERAYSSGGTWSPYPPVNVSGNMASSYTFEFVGDQPGRWRVQACNASACTGFTAWKTFSYSTRPQLNTPLQTSPAANLVFDHYPRMMTLTWKPVVGAIGYNVDIQYCSQDGGTCWSYPQVFTRYTVRGFEFVGAQPGKWRVTAVGNTEYSDSEPSKWRAFRFSR